MIGTELLTIFYRPITTIDNKVEESHIDKASIYAYEDLTQKYFKALKFYCPDCDRGFASKIAKITHLRWHKGNPLKGES